MTALANHLMRGRGQPASFAAKVSAFARCLFKMTTASNMGAALAFLYFFTHTVLPLMFAHYPQMVRGPNFGFVPLDRRPPQGPSHGNRALFDRGNIVGIFNSYQEVHIALGVANAAGIALSISSDCHAKVPHSERVGETLLPRAFSLLPIPAPHHRLQSDAYGRRAHDFIIGYSSAF
jgi:hypothetical protein